MSFTELEVVDGPGQGTRFSLTANDVVLVGRSARCHFSIGTDTRASRIHFLLEASPSGVWVRDLGSLHGLFVNERKVMESEVQEGDRIRLGTTTLLLHAEAVPQSGHPSDSEDAVFEDTVPPDATGRFSGYILESLLSDVGSMGLVYLARDLTNGMLVVIKVMRPEKRRQGQMDDLFLRESKVSLSLTHPNIVKFIEAGEQHGEMFIVMEYVRGMDADSLREKRGDRLPWQDVVEIGCQVLLALEYAHEHPKAIVHRDIKPSNILVCGSSLDDYEVKVTDFGLARSYRKHGFTSLTQAGTIRGTPSFMPPEQVMDCRRVDHRADLFSLGATLYNLLTNEIVYPFSKHKDLFMTIVEDDIVPVERHGVALPADLIGVIHRTLERVPERRYQSAREMRESLCKIRSG